ncbi:UDP-N-acetylmuramoyl-tripeptide--D-alanyl-D-alanine ligase [Actinotalea sp. K2]|uniref:UDP-N-acetylmuramoyl-tripeptide--D-alanyl-D- alanine ligase n=1 Tax=Actinotalea sp. K2 TaxID=2939438 RepID=UPI002016ED9A|nr:UDP-N-acetylmuramoyl-tripeptide--D-alanyl-D-alanine ligase [Actinotalea sp. K2]MCL3860125.1 UDP-N-acetylmuramoyl-tripeptide--D-alanyl-D-alanine ligase [Actinotalea sp. K2]
MIDLSAEQVAAATGGRLIGDPQTVVTGPVVSDSRQVVPGALFAALPGDQVDGHEYAERAVATGAVLVLATRAIEGPDGPLPVVVVPDVTVALGDLARSVLGRLRSAGDIQVVAITGSVGKTTTKDVLAQVLRPAGPTVWPEASFNNEIGLPLTVLRADATTRFLVLEMGASGIGHIDYLTAIARPDVAVVLVVGSAHLGEFGGIDAVARAKAEIVTGLVPGGTAVLNGDDQRVAAMAAVAPGRVVLFGEEAAAAVRAVQVRLDDEGRARFDLTTPVGTAPVHLRLVGEHHVHNALAAAAAALELGLDLADVAEALTTAEALSPHRMHVTERPDGVTVIDDSYNANPESMRAALKALAVRSAGRRRTIAVLGEMLELGPDAVEAHDAIGRLAVRLNISRLVVVGDGARAMHTGAFQEGSWGQESRLVEDVEAAATWLDQELTEGDVVLVKSSHGAGLWRLGDRLAAGGADAR